MRIMIAAALATILAGCVSQEELVNQQRVANEMRLQQAASWQQTCKGDTACITALARASTAASQVSALAASEAAAQQADSYELGLLGLQLMQMGQPRPLSPIGQGGFTCNTVGEYTTCNPR